MKNDNEREFEKYLGQFPLRDMPSELHERIFGTTETTIAPIKAASRFRRHKVKWAVAALFLISVGTATLYLQPAPPTQQPAPNPDPTTVTTTATERQQPLTMLELELELMEAQESAQLLALAKMNFEMGTSRGYILCQEIVEKYPNSSESTEARKFLENNYGNMN